MPDVTFSSSITALTSMLNYYKAAGIMTDPGEYTPLLDNLPHDMAGLCRIVQGLLLHPFWAKEYGETLSVRRKRDLLLRPLPAMLKRLLEIQDQPLTVARLPRERLVGNCRDAALFLCALLRQQGIPARVRCGFAVYYEYDDHWVTEYWSHIAKRWILVDPEIDEIHERVLKMNFDPQNLPREQFILAGEAWQLYRNEQVDPRRFGFRSWRGTKFIAGSVIRDLAALNKIELLAWDLNDGKSPFQNARRLSAEEIKQLDQIANLTINDEPEHFPELRAAYEQSPHIHRAVERITDKLFQEQDDTSFLPEKDNPFIALLQGEEATAAGEKPIQRRSKARQQVQQQVNTLEPDKLVIRGAQQHNLKNINVSMPRYKFIVLTGVSGSGKSSLAFDTIYAEGQRRYVESLSPFVRHFLDTVEKPKVDFIGGLSPAIAIEQKTVSKNPRSSVGTITEIMDYLRLLFSRTGTAHCLHCGYAIKPQTATEMGQRVTTLPGGTELDLLAPIIKQRKGNQADSIEQALRDGYTHARIDGKEHCSLSEARLAENKKHTIELLVDHLKVPEQADYSWHDHLIVSLRKALKQGNGSVIVTLSNGNDVLLSEEKVCANCGKKFPELFSAHFSPNSPFGMCTMCNGLGNRLEVDPELIVEDASLSILDGALRWYGNMRKKKSHWQLDYVRSIAEHYSIDLEQAWQDLPQHFRDILIYGSGEEKIKINRQNEWASGSWSHESEDTVPGIIADINRRFRQTSSEGTRQWYSSFMSKQPCRTCSGTRLSAEVRAVTLDGKNIHEVSNMTLDQVLEWLDELYETLDDETFTIANEILKEVSQRIQFMLNVGLHYLTLDRPAPSLSGGEGQRIRLASQLSCGLVGVLYVLDEPSIGLHARDQQTLLQTLLQLRDLGNTVLVVEHDAETMRNADWLIDMGPGAGILGGEVVVAGTPAVVAQDPRSLTGRYLTGELQVRRTGNQSRRVAEQGWLTISGATLHNLKKIEVRLPIGLLTCITGVSGSGKSSLINGTLYPALTNALHDTKEQPGPFTHLEGLEHLNKVINITQDAIGRTPRSNPATYAGIFDDIRAVFADTPEARQRGYKADRFSFNVEGGRCESCKGHGQKVVEMHFLADVWVRCKECQGSRYNHETLEIRYKGKHIADVLAMDVQEALEFFIDKPKLAHMLQTLHDVGLDYIKLGQSATTLSGGEAQRIKLAKELSRLATGRTLYILDEPTTGLHFSDIQRLLDVLHRLVEAGNTVLVIEHNLDIIKTADWIIDMGPEGGEEGGYIIGEGTPETLVQVKNSATGHFLNKVLR